MKRCVKCRRNKLLDMFYKSRTARDGLDSSCKECRKAQVNRYNAEHRFEQVARTQQWRKDNPERVREYDRTHYKKPHVQAWKVNNNLKRRARLARVPSENIDINVLYGRDGEICGLCGTHVERLDASVDHIKCVANGGHNTWDNVQLAHLTCNVRKGNRPVFLRFREDE